MIYTVDVIGSSPVGPTIESAGQSLIIRYGRPSWAVQSGFVSVSCRWSSSRAAAAIEYGDYVKTMREIVEIA
jgi:hypothetical protein